MNLVFLQLNDLVVVGCHTYNRDLKGAFRQFSTDPGDYMFAGLNWEWEIYIDVRLVMGLRSLAYCYQFIMKMGEKL